MALPRLRNKLKHVFSKPEPTAISKSESTISSTDLTSESVSQDIPTCSESASCQSSTIRTENVTEAITLQAAPSEPNISPPPESKPTPVPSPQHVPLSITPPPPAQEANPAPKTGPSWGSITWNALKTLIEVIKESSDVFPPLKSAASGLSAVITRVEQSIGNKERAGRSLPKVEALQAMLKDHSDDLDTAEVGRRNNLAKKLVHITEGLETILPQNGIVGFVMGADQQAKISDLIEDIRDAITEYQACGLVACSKAYGTNDGAIRYLFSKTSIKRAVKSSYLRATLGAFNLHHFPVVELSLLNNLPRARDAAYNAGDRDKCLRGTRLGVLEKIEAWAADSGEHRIHWLNGLAGTGKTAIAQTFAENAFAQGWLGASFFCSRDSADRRNIKLIFPTLAVQLASRFPKIRESILSVLKFDLDVGNSSLSGQLRKLIVEPLKNAGVSTIIVIDALDECEDQATISSILSLLSKCIDEIPLVKFFITSRPEPQVRAAFLKTQLKPITDVFLLHEVEKEVVDDDIRKYIQHRLACLAAERSDFDMTIAWPTELDLTSLTRKCGGLFIYASTACNYISDVYRDPRDQLCVVISTTSTTVGEGQSGIDDLYSHVLQQAFPATRTTEVTLFRLVVGFILHVSYPVSRIALAALLGLEISQVKRTLRSLHSVILVPEDDSKAIHILHASFFDYLTRENRCSKHLRIDSPPLHFDMAVHSLQLIAKKGKKNICSISPYALNKEVTDLDARQKEFIGDALAYACQFFAHHLSSASWGDNCIKAIVPLLDDFFENQVLNWMEVLSIIGELGKAPYSLGDVKAWLDKVGIFEGRLVDMFNDSRRFLWDSFECIQQSARHIYHSALPNAPESCLLRKKYIQTIEGEPRTVNRQRISWGAYRMSISVDDSALSVAYSPDGCTLAVGTGCNSIRIFDAVSGLQLATWKDTVPALSISFSPNGSLLVSGAGTKTIKIWNVNTGCVTRTFNNCDPCCNSAHVSPNGIHLVAGRSLMTGSVVPSEVSYDPLFIEATEAEVVVWDILSGDVVASLHEGSARATSVCWLDDWNVLYGGNGLARLWNFGSGDPVEVASEVQSPNPDPGRHADEDSLKFEAQDRGSKNGADGGDKDQLSGKLGRGDVCVVNGGWLAVSQFPMSGMGDRWRALSTYMNTSDWKGEDRVASSADGSVFAFAPRTSVWVHDAKSSKVLAKFYTEEAVSCVALSPKGDYVAFTVKNDLYIKGMQYKDEPFQKFAGHLGHISSISFSPDGTSIASSSLDRSVKLWDNQSSPKNHIAADSNESPITALCFSTNEKVIASVSEGSSYSIRSLKLFDSSNGALIRSVGLEIPHTDRLGSMEAIAISPDGHNLVMATCDYIMLMDMRAVGLQNLRSCHQISFSADGAHAYGLRQWLIEPDNNPESFTGYYYPSSFRLKPIEGKNDQFVEELPASTFTLSPNAEWILDPNDRHVFWIIPASRGRKCVSTGSKFAVGTERGQVIIFDLTNVTKL